MLVEKVFTGDQFVKYGRILAAAYESEGQVHAGVYFKDKDGAVDFTQGIFYYNTLRRLQKPVVMLEYKGENHGLRVPANMKDYTVRMREFFDHQLKGKPAPKWWTEGVPLLKLKEELEERAPGKPPTIDPLKDDTQ